MKRVLAPALCLLAALFMVLPVALRPGWPYSHDYASPFERIEGFRRAFLALDFFPTWTPFAFNGHGSPTPLIYHRLFSVVGGLISLPLGSDLGTRVTLVAFAWFGAWGLYRVARRLEIGPSRALLVAVAFLWAPYSLTDWLVRGSVAEFASMMVLPWLLEAMVRQLQGERVWLSLGLSLAAVMHAHQSLGLYLAPLPVLSTALSLLRPGRGRALVDALQAAGLALVLTLPWLLPVLRVGDAFRLDTLKIYVPQAQYVPWERYVIDDAFAWGHTFQGFSTELSRWLLLAAGLAVVAAFFSGAKATRPREFVFFGLIFLGAGALQFEIATPVYQAVPKAELLQFPWRLLGVLTPVACLLFGMLIEAIARRERLWPAVATGLALYVVVHHGLRTRQAQRLDYPAYTARGLGEKIHDLDGPWSAGEYLPKNTPSTPDRTPWVTVTGCTTKRVSPPVPTHFKRLEVELEPGPACRVVFSQFASPILAVEGDGTRADEGPFIAVNVPAGGKSVVVRRKNLLELW